MITLLLDFSNIAHATFHVVQHDREFKTKENYFDEKKLQYWKFLILNSICTSITIHKPNELVVCADSRSWRKKFFPYYKARRDLAKEKSDINYIKFFECINQFLAEIDHHFPYKLMQVNMAEADDIIGILSHELKKERDLIIIGSNDKDFKQLINDKVKLWNLKDKKWVMINDPKEYLIKHILQGDAGDDVPNVRSDDDTFICEGKRQKPCGNKTIEKIFEMGVQEWIEREDLLDNWRRNKKLVELSRLSIPPKLWNFVIKKYKSLDDKDGDYIKILQYFRKNNFRLENNVNKFLLNKKEPKLVDFDF